MCLVVWPNILKKKMTFRTMFVIFSKSFAAILEVRADNIHHQVQMRNDMRQGCPAVVNSKCCHIFINPFPLQQMAF